VCKHNLLSKEREFRTVFSVLFSLDRKGSTQKMYIYSLYNSTRLIKSNP